MQGLKHAGHWGGQPQSQAGNSRRIADCRTSQPRPTLRQGKHGIRRFDLSLSPSLSRAGRKRRKPDTPSLARERAPVVHYLSLPLLLPQGSSLSLLQHGQGSVTRDRPPARIRALGNSGAERIVVCTRPDSPAIHPKPSIITLVPPTRLEALYGGVGHWGHGSAEVGLAGRVRPSIKPPNPEH